MKSNFSSPRKKSRGIRVGKKTRVPSKFCHQCRQEIKFFAATCKNLRKRKSCFLRFCKKCLLDRYGEEAKKVNLLNNWMCPKCRGICNCSVCMRLKHQPPTGALVRIAKASGFTCVSEMLSKMEAEKLELSMGNNTNVGPIKEEYALGKEVLVEEKYCPTHCVAMGTEDWAGNVLFSDPSPLSSTHTINWDGTIVIGDNDIGRLNSHMEIDQLQILDNNAIRPERELIEEEISHPSGPNIENVLDVEFQRENAASEMQFVDFNTLIGKALELPKDEDVEELCEADEDEHGENSCGACGEQYGPDEFWIFCDICERWFHGKCVNITPARAKHIEIYKCPSCNNNKRARP